ncbi:MAG: ADP-L-glycero-D-manno-heptose-6-epimerase [Bacteroidota bacterium]|nr:MAG: ADP-L-glycero-D-manno-heptose-6-epimerase [Bacteroidota bacterium]
MIVVTGAAGFIGSCLISFLNKEGYKDIVAVDNFSNEIKNKNIENKILTAKIHRDVFFKWLDENEKFVQFIFHIGARTDTTEFDVSIFNTLNLDYSKKVWQKCVQYGIPLVYASSAATYGMGEYGYSDSTSPSVLKPLNPYGDSKNDFDKWALEQERKPYFWAGLKFFNVYGPNEYHKGRMASVIFHAYKQIIDSEKLNLFQSHHPLFKDGEQMRDFVYVKDVISVCAFLMEHRKNNGIYNLGSGKARTFLDLANYTFSALNKKPNIEFIPTPEDIRGKYQYFTEADMQKLHAIGYQKPFYTLEEGVEDYVKNYLMKNSYF